MHILILIDPEKAKTKLSFFFFLFLVHIQACRALTIIALILGLVGIILSTMGLKCIKIGSKTDESKGKTMVIGGIIFISAGKQNYSMCAYELKQFLLFNCLHVLFSIYLQIQLLREIFLFPIGLCTMVAVSWYAARIVAEFNDPFYGGVK